MNQGVIGGIVGVVVVFAVVMAVGCKDQPAPPRTPAAASKLRPNGLTFTYTKKRLEEIGFGAAAINSFNPDGLDVKVASEPYQGHVNFRPIKFDSVACEAELKTLSFLPMNMVINIDMDGFDPKDKIVFRVLVGPVGEGAGMMVPADAKCPNLQVNEPVYSALNGWTILGGYMPAARGRRSRAGAPGTQFAIESVGVKEDQTDVDRYYLLSQPYSQDPPPPQQQPSVAVIGDNDSSVYSLKDRDYYIEVDSTGKISKPIKIIVNDPRWVFRENAVKVASCTKLPGKH